MHGRRRLTAGDRLSASRAVEERRASKTLILRTDAIFFLPKTSNYELELERCCAHEATATVATPSAR